MTLHDDHGELPGHAEVLLRRLERIRDLSVRSKHIHAQHIHFAERCRVLGDHLRGVLTLSTDHHYAAALGLTRTALEHHLMDRLLFLANRWIQETNIKTRAVPAEEARLAALKAGPRPDLVRWWYDPPPVGTMKILIRGIFREGSLGRGLTVSPYYFWIDQFDPFTVTKKVSSRVATGFGDRDMEVRRAAESKRERLRYFTFDKLQRNLDANSLLQPRLGVQVDVHHAFLSAFVHGAHHAYSLLHGSNSPSRLGYFDHYASELALLYVIAIAAAEIETYGRMAKRPPRLGLLQWQVVEAEIAAARAATSYFWFLSGEPTMYDRIHELHTRIPRPSTSGNFAVPARALVNPASLNPSRVRYYTNPFRRLVKLHETSQELVSGHFFQSPFPRPDARLR